MEIDKNLLLAIESAVFSDDSPALKEAASKLESELKGTSYENAHKAAHILRVMAGVRDTNNTRKVYEYLKNEMNKIP